MREGFNIEAEQLNLKDGEEHKGETLYPQINKETLCSHSQTTIATSELPVMLYIGKKDTAVLFKKRHMA